MKLCPSCTSGYHDSQTTCPTHGGVLSEIRELKPGMIVHKTYRIVRKLGEGGMGTVYLADHIFMEEQRALKFLAADLSLDEALTGRFRREVRTLRQIRHKNVVDCGDLEPAEDDSLFFPMEFVNGPDLRDFLRNSSRPFDVPLALAITRGIAEGLGAAHALGMVHRDIKPENILMAHVAGDTGAGNDPKIADFGIVATKESSTKYTKTGGTLLTMPYAAPEQWRGTAAKDLDGRTDLYALGGVLFEMLTGRTVFDADSYEAWSEQHRNSAPQPPSIVRLDLSEWRGLDALVLRLLAKDLDHRPKDAAELVGLIDAVEHRAPETDRATALEGGTPAATLPDGEKTAKPSPSKRILIASLAVCGLLAATAVAVGLWRNSHQLNQSPRPTASAAQSPPSASTPTLPQPTGPLPKQPLRIEPAKPGVAGPQASATVPAEAPMPAIQASSPAEEEKKASVLYGQKRYLEAESLYDQACSGGLGSSCKQLGGMYEHGEGVALNYSRAVSLYSKGCIEGDKSSCDALIPMYVKGQVTSQDASRADDAFSSACDAGNAHGCASLGFMYERAAGVARDYPRAAALYSKGCDGGDARGCLNLGVMYATGSGVGADFAKAFSLLTKACDGGEAAWLRRPGLGV